MTDTKPANVVLRGGISVPRAAPELAWVLEARGLALEVDSRHTLLIGPKRFLTGADHDAIREHRIGLVTIVRYCDQEEAPC